MRIVVAGGSGFIGEPLVRRLVAGGHEVAVLTRNASRVQAGRPVEWDGRTDGGWSEEIANADAIINLAGENIAEGRWTEERKQRLTASRLDATRALIDAMRRYPPRPRTFINASAVGYYGDRKDEELDERSPRGSGFLAELVDQWESAAHEAELLARLVILRFGVVLARDGGALAKMLVPFRLGAGGPIGSGTQWMSWIERDDVVSMIVWALENDHVRGVYNATSPRPVRNRDFTRALGRALRRPAFIPAPAFALRIAFGQMADEALIAGQKVLPKHAESDGFVFGHATLEAALASALRAPSRE